MRRRHPRGIRMTVWPLLHRAETYQAVFRPTNFCIHCGRAMWNFVCLNTNVGIWLFGAYSNFGFMEQNCWWTGLCRIRWVWKPSCQHACTSRLCRRVYASMIMAFAKPFHLPNIHHPHCLGGTTGVCTAVSPVHNHGFDDRSPLFLMTMCIYRRRLHEKSVGRYSGIYYNPENNEYELVEY